MFLNSKKAFVIFIGVSVILVFGFFQKPVKNAVYSMSFPVQNFFWNIGQNISNWTTAILRVVEIEKENKELKAENQELLEKTTTLEELEEENRVLRDALEVGLENEFKLEVVKVFGKDFSQDSVLINKGERDGIRKDLPLIDQNKVLFGKVEEVYDNFSRVSLISCQDSAFDVRVVGKEIFGVIKGKGNLDMYLDLIPPEADIKTGDVLITSALAQRFPQFLLVGRIKEVRKEDIKPFQQAEIDPFFNIKTADNLFIILDF